MHNPHGHEAAHKAAHEAEAVGVVLLLIVGRAVLKNKSGTGLLEDFNVAGSGHGGVLNLKLMRVFGERNRHQLSRRIVPCEMTRSRGVPESTSSTGKMWEASLR